MSKKLAFVAKSPAFFFKVRKTGPFLCDIIGVRRGGERFYMADKEIDYAKIRYFWNRRAGKAGKMDSRSITFFCEEPEALAFRDRREKRIFEERVSLTGGEKILEVGCGSGRWTAFLAPRCRRLVSFDFAEDLVKVNREASGEEGIENVEFVVSDLLELDLPEKDFDLAVCFGVSHYIKDGDLVGAYRNLSRHLRAGGRLLSKEPIAVAERIEIVDEYDEFLGCRYTCLYRPRGELETAIQEAGFAKEWGLPVYGPDEPLAPQRDGVETWFTQWRKDSPENLPD